MSVDWSQAIRTYLAELPPIPNDHHLRFEGDDMAKSKAPEVGTTVTYVREDGTETLGQVLGSDDVGTDLQLINEPGAPSVYAVQRGDGPGQYRTEVDAGDGDGGSEGGKSDGGSAGGGR